MADDLMNKILGEIAAPKVVMPPPPEPLVTPPAPVIIPASDLRRMMPPPPEQIVDPDGDVGLPQIEDVKPRTQFVDEVDAYMKSKFAAAKETPDEFYQRVIEQQRAREALGEESPFVRQNPRSAAKAMLGNVALVQSGTGGSQAPEVVRWTGEDIEATNFTISLGLVGLPPAGNAPKIIRPYGIVQWGTRGFLHTVEVDIGLGCQFVLAGSFCSVQVAMDDDGSTNQGQANLSGMLSFRNVQHGPSMTRTKYTSSAAGARTVQVPAFAKSVYIFGSDVAQTYAIQFVDWAGNVAYTFTTTANSIMSTPLPLAGDIEQIIITPSGTAAVRAVFELAI